MKRKMIKNDYRMTGILFLLSALINFAYGQHREAQGNVQKTIEILAGEINEHSRIACTASGQPDYADSHDVWYPLPFNGGPSMDYANQTSCYAITTASITVGTNTKKQYTWTFDLKGKCGGKCGPDGSNAGGEGHAAPEYRTTIKLPVTPDSSLWTINFKGSATYGGGNTTVTVTGNGIDTSFIFDRSGNPGKLTLKNLKPGEYKLNMRSPEISRGCYGASQGSDGQANFTTTLNIDIIRVDRQ